MTDRTTAQEGARKPESARAGGKRRRDVRIDVFRGVAMFIIFIAHVEANPWTQWIPARFGPSDAAEWFVFCSGFASAVAFGGVFLRHGFLLGAARVLYRCWQIYWAQIGLFLATAATCVVGTWLLDTRDYVGQLNLYPFFEDPMRGLIGLFTVTYVPNLFDILPMYMVVLLMVPVLVALRRMHPWAPMAAAVALWGANRAFGFELPAEWWSDREWYFNPFGWQLLFFTGFAIASGWLRSPPPDRRLIALATGYVLFMIPINWHPIWSNVEIFERIGLAILWGFQKTDFGIFRYLHFLAIAYLLRCAFLGREEILYHPLVAPVRRVGQQALAVFVSSIVLGRVAGMVLDVTGRGDLAAALVNLVGFVILGLIAYLVAWIKAEPWRRPGPAKRTDERKEEKSGPTARAAE